MWERWANGVGYGGCRLAAPEGVVKPARGILPASQASGSCADRWRPTPLCQLHRACSTMPHLPHLPVYPHHHDS